MTFFPCQCPQIFVSYDSNPTTLTSFTNNALKTNVKITGEGADLFSGRRQFDSMDSFSDFETLNCSRRILLQQQPYWHPSNERGQCYPHGRVYQHSSWALVPGEFSRGSRAHTHHKLTTVTAFLVLRCDPLLKPDAQRGHHLHRRPHGHQESQRCRRSGCGWRDVQLIFINHI